MRLRIRITGECNKDCGLDSIGYLGLCGTTTTPGGTSSNVYDPEIILIDDEDSKIVNWTTLRRSRYGVFPTVQVWLRDDTDKLYLSSIQPEVDDAPPDFTVMTFTFTGPENGFIKISK